MRIRQETELGGIWLNVIVFIKNNNPSQETCFDISY